MSHPQSRQLNASLSPLVQAKDLFLEVAAVTTLSTSVFALLGCITAHSVSATEVETAAEETTVEVVTVSDSSNIDSSPVSTSAADLQNTSSTASESTSATDSSESLEIRLGDDVRIFDCLTEVPPEARQYCVPPGGSIEIVPPETPFNPQDFTVEPVGVSTSFPEWVPPSSIVEPTDVFILDPTHIIELPLLRF